MSHSQTTGGTHTDRIVHHQQTQQQITSSLHRTFGAPSTETQLGPRETVNEESVVVGRLILRARSARTLEPDAPRVQWSEDVVDNEQLNRKKSKSECLGYHGLTVFIRSFVVCCIFKKHRNFNESDSETSSDESGDDNNEKDSEKDTRNAYERPPRNRPARRRHHDCQHDHGSSSHHHKHQHHQHDNKSI